MSSKNYTKNANIAKKNTVVASIKQAYDNADPSDQYTYELEQLLINRASRIKVESAEKPSDTRLLRSSKFLFGVFTGIVVFAAICLLILAAVGVLGKTTGLFVSERTGIDGNIPTYLPNENKNGADVTPITATPTSSVTSLPVKTVLPTDFPSQEVTGVSLGDSLFDRISNRCGINKRKGMGLDDIPVSIDLSIVNNDINCLSYTGEGGGFLEGTYYVNSEFANKTGQIAPITVYDERSQNLPRGGVLSIKSLPYGSDAPSYITSNEIKNGKLYLYFEWSYPDVMGDSTATEMYYSTIIYVRGIRELDYADGKKIYVSTVIPFIEPQYDPDTWKVMANDVLHDYFVATLGREPGEYTAEEEEKLKANLAQYFFGSDRNMELSEANAVSAAVDFVQSIDIKQ